MTIQVWWPLAGLRVRTPWLELRFPDDELIAALADLAAQGIHDQATMPFVQPFTDLPADGTLQRSVAQYLWRCRADLGRDRWALPLAVLEGSQVVGLQSVEATGFAHRRSVTTGSWLGLRHQGRGIGTEMRTAALHLAFAGLGAIAARSSAFDDNAASVAVTTKLGYRRRGVSLAERRGAPAIAVDYELTRAAWRTRLRSDITIHGLPAVLQLLGAERPASSVGAEGRAEGDGGASSP